MSPPFAVHLNVKLQRSIFFSTYYPFGLNRKLPMVLLPLGNSSLELEVRVVINNSTANLVSVSKQEQDL